MQGHVEVVLALHLVAFVHEWKQEEWVIWCSRSQTVVNEKSVAQLTDLHTLPLKYLGSLCFFLRIIISIYKKHLFCFNIF